jgi:hypothetical protein
MHFPHFKKHSDKTEPAPKEEHKHKDEPVQDLPKGFVNDAMRSSSKPDTLYNFDDPMRRRLGPVPSTDPTNTGA